MTESLTLSSLGAKLQESKQKILQKDFRGAWEQLQTLRGEASEPAEQEDLLYQLGVCMNGLEKPAEAINFLNRSLKLAEALQDPVAQARSVEELGGAHHQRGDYRGAEVFYERAHKVYQKLEDAAGIARGFRNLGGVRVDLGHITQAATDFNTAREQFSKLGDTEGVATCVTNLALLTYRHKGRKAAVEDYLQHLSKGDSSHYLVYNNLGFLQLMEEQLPEAREHLLLGVKDCEQRHIEDDNIGLLFLNLGVLDLLEGKYAEADQNLGKAALVFTNYPQGRAVLVAVLPEMAQTEHELGRFLVAEDGHKLAITLLNSAMVQSRQGHHEQAELLAKKAIELDKEQGYPYALLGWILKAAGDQTSAGQAFHRALGKEPNNALIRRSLDVTNPYLGQKTGRNEPCPCQSGKKFKKCHGAG